MATTKGESKSPIIPSQLISAREGLALSPRQAADHLRITAEEVDSWERGDSAPELEQLWALAEFYGRDTEYFLRPTAPLPEINFRLSGQKTFRQLPLEARKVVARFDELCRAQSELEDFLGARKVRVVKPAIEGDGHKLAKVERRRLGLDSQPIANLRNLLENLGVRVFLLPVPGEVFSGFSWWHADYGPCILVNARDNPGRRNFTMAHEYAHLLGPDQPSLCSLTRSRHVIETSDERQATRFAICFLMPEEDVVEQFRRRELSPGTITDYRLGALATRYGVSLEAIGRRLEELDLVPRGITDSRIEAWERRPKRSGRGARAPSWRRQLGELYISTTFQAYEKGRISIGTLAHYLGISVRKALEEARKVSATELPHQDA